MKTKFLSVLALTAILFASCSNSDDNTTPEVNDGRVQFSSGVNVATLRVAGGATGNEWEGNESIGIYMVEKGGTTVAEGATNIKYTTTSTGTSATFTSTTPIYYPVNTPAKVNFIAYHPYAAAVANYVYPVNVATQSSQSAIDLMVAKADNSTAGYDKANTSAVNLVFDHQLAKVMINVIKGDGVTDLTGLAVKIKGMNTTAAFDISNPALSNEGNAADITPCSTSSTNYEVILLPVATLGTSHVVEFTVGTNVYKWTINNAGNLNNVTKLEKGKIYTFDVTLQKTKVAVEGSITTWVSTGATSGTAN